jgi:hypothetical protein
VLSSKGHAQRKLHLPRRIHRRCHFPEIRVARRNCFHRGCRCAAARKAGLAQKVSPPWMRHCMPIHFVQAPLGDVSVSITGRYLHARLRESSSLYLPD